MDLPETDHEMQEADVIVLDDSGEQATDSGLNITEASTSEKSAAECMTMEIDQVDSTTTSNTNLLTNLDNEADHFTKEISDQVESTSSTSHTNLTTNSDSQSDDFTKEIDQIDFNSISHTNLSTSLDTIEDTNAGTAETEPQEQLACTENLSDILILNTQSEQADKDLNQTVTNVIVRDSGETEQAAGACEELCIIPDTDRVITQAEKDAAALLPPVRDATEAVETSTNVNSLQTSLGAGSDKFVISNCTEETINVCEHCCLPRKSKYKVTCGSNTLFVCDDTCLTGYKSTKGDQISNLEDNIQDKQSLVSGTAAQLVTFSRKCMHCNTQIIETSQLNLSWETLEFCNGHCLAKYQKLIGSNCSKCQTPVQENCMGKYCVRFGYNIRQFCTSTCLEQYKKGLKVCSYCQKEMCEEGFLAPVTDKGLFKDFCSKECLDKYKALSSASETPAIKGACSVCLNDKPTIIFDYSNKRNQFCGEPCFVAFKFVNNISTGKCDMCHKYFDIVVITEYTMYYDDALRSFCSKGCQNVYIIANRKIVSCNWCKVKKYNFDMIKRHSDTGSAVLTCSLNCLHQFLASNDSSNWTICDQCDKPKHPLYHLTMSDDTLRTFCSYSCVLGFQTKFPKAHTLVNTPVPTSGPKRFIPPTTKNAEPEVPTIPIITSVQSLANLNGPSSPYSKKRTKQNGVVSHRVNATPQTIVKTQIRQQVIIRPAFPVAQRNVGTMCKVTMFTKGSNCNKIITANKAIQTDEVKDKIVIIPIPVPIYIPLPLRMYSQPFPVPFPFPLPLPIPIFIPTTRNSAKGIMKEMQKIQAKMPSNPLEAELLMMADIVAGDKKDDATDSETEGEEPIETAEERVYTPEPGDANSSFGEEVLQMAIKMAAELDEPAVDLEGALAVNTVTASIKIENPVIAQVVKEEPIHAVERKPTRGRGGRGSRGRRSSRRTVSQSQPEVSILGMEQPEPPSEPLEKPDANMCLKYTFGVNAWKQWVSTKNAELEQSSSRAKLFKPEILQLTADELNYSLCLFVKEVRKPNGQEYAPDTIYYLCLGIQQYLYENGRIDNIFCDTYYEKFTECLDEVARKFSVLYNDSHYIITRVEEEHLWESKQLGAHSPHVLLSTLMFFNTKHFNLTSVEDHMQLSFSHIMKHWKRNPTHSGSQKSAGSRNVLLRFYPPQTTPDGISTRKKKVYEQQENEDNPLRCPVKLYEFYLSKCPESVKTRNDVFYLLPERSCVPDSPVWYSTSALPKDALEKMLHRVKMVKEINVALLTS